MSIKFLAIALVAVLSLQGCVEASGILSAGNVKEIANRGIVEEVQKLIEELQNLVNDIIKAGLAALEDAKEKVEELIKNIMSETLAKIKNLSEKIKAEIEELRKKAAELGEHVVECVDEAAAKVDTLVEKAQADAQVCVEGVLDHVNTIFGNVVEVANDVTSELAEIIDDATHCKIFDIPCWLKVSVKGAALVTRINIEVRKLIASSIAEIAGASVELTVCIAPIMADYTAGITAISAQAAKCLIS